MAFTYYDTKIYKMGSMYKMVYFPQFDNEGHIYDKEDKEIKESSKDEKLINNVIRAKSTVMELGHCNDWSYFATFTLDKTKYNRTDLDIFREDLTQWIRLERRRGFSWSYILIPELHKDDESWHIHAVINGLDESKLNKFSKAAGHPHKLYSQGYLFDKRLQNKFGYNSFCKIKNKDACIFYITKYYRKAMKSKGKIELGSHLYYCSQNLIRKELIKEGCTAFPILGTKFNDFTGIRWFTNKSLETVLDTID